MNPIAAVKTHWRVLLLVAFVTLAVVALFYPGGIMADDTVIENESVDENPTNLEYGLGLDGGTRISAPPIGMTADDIEVPDNDRQAVQRTLYEELDLETADALVRFDNDENRYSAEVFTDDVDEGEFADALNEAGVTVDGEPVEEGDIEDHVTQETRNEIIQTIQDKINQAGLSGGTAYESSTIDGYYIVTEVPDMEPGELQDLLEDRGVVEVRAHYPGEDGEQQNETVLEQGDFDTIGAASYNSQSGHHVPVTIDPGTAPEYQQQMVDMGFTTREGSTAGVGCQFDESNPDRENYCLLTRVDGEVVDAHGMAYDLGQSMDSGQWENDPTFNMLTPGQQEAHSLAINLRAGALTAPLDFSDDQVFMLDPALADQFKTYSLLIGVLSVLTVSGMVYLRYRDPRVALPMIVTAMSEVVILLGFAALIRMPLDLSHVAGFIAVVGTGVDDLIIIADEVMDEGDVNSRRVFESRFRKAFWVIGAAAATTILAMSPLAVLSLGDLRGFAIITILGVLIGVLITRPAYGDILQRLLTDR